MYRDLIAVTNRHLCSRPFTEQITRVCKLHPKALILREKDLPEEEYFSLARQVKEICEQFKVPFIPHFYPAVARELGCDRLHLPLPLLLENPKVVSDFHTVGTSIHSVSEAVEAEKRIASLEGERKSFNKGKRDSEFKLESKTGELRNNTAFIDAMTEDWNRFLSVVQTDKEGNRLNIIKVDGVDSADEKVIGKRLQEIAKNATTGGLYTQVGELYGFPIKVVSERILKEGLEFTDNRFVVEGNYKYTYNNGHLAMADPLAAARNFLNAMERIPSIIDQYKAKNEVLEMEIPQLQEIAGKVWKKEDELKQLKSELAALDRKIQLELAPPTPEVAEKENEGQQLKPEAEDVRNRQAQYPENAPPQIRSPADSIVANHVIIGRPGLYAKEETRFKGLKI